MNAVETKAAQGNWCYIGVDETRNWNIEAELMQHVERILAIYLVNRAEYTYCCEITPSHWCRCIAYDVHVKFEAPEAASEALHEIVNGESPADNDCYMHVSLVNRLINDHPKRFHQAETPDPEDHDTETKVVDDLIEKWNSNPSF